ARSPPRVPASRCAITPGPTGATARARPAMAMALALAVALAPAVAVTTPTTTAPSRCSFSSPARDAPCACPTGLTRSGRSGSGPMKQLDSRERSPEADVLVGGRFSIEARAGAGGMGEIFRARDQRD